MAASIKFLVGARSSSKCLFSIAQRMVISQRGAAWHARLIEELWQQPDDAKTFEEVKKEKFPEPDPDVYSEVDIGFPLPDSTKTAIQTDKKVKIARRGSIVSKTELERLARKRELLVPLDQVDQAWRTELGPVQIRDVAQHYGVFRDLYGLAYFHPVVSLEVQYMLDQDSCLPVYRGNVIDPEIAQKAPEVTYEAETGSLWTLVMTSPDEHLQEQNKEYLHWMVANIPGNRVSEGELLCPYLPPLPARGTGKHRYVFVLYKQNQRLDLSQHQLSSQSPSLLERTFDTYTFYKQYQDEITPAGLAFYQAEWDESVTNTFHNILDMREPSYEYDYPHDYREEQELIPHKHPFNLYMDKYRDVKEINEQVLREKFKMTNPFKPQPKRPKYPNIFHIDDGVPFWYKEETVRRRFREEKYKLLDEGK